MRYFITDTSVIKISETYGTIQNISRNKVEISNSADFKNVYLLYPQTEVTFNEQLYIRVFGNGEKNFYVLVNVVQFINNGKSNSSTGTDNTDSDVNNYIDNVFNGGDDNSNDTDFGNYIDDIFNGSNDNSDDSDVDSYLDDVWSNAG